MKKRVVLVVVFLLIAGSLIFSVSAAADSSPCTREGEFNRYQLNPGNGQCEYQQSADVPPRCSACGDGFCDETLEDKCNCPEDCIGFIGIGKINISFCENGQTKNFLCGDDSEIEICKCAAGKWKCDIKDIFEICNNRTMEKIKRMNRPNLNFVPWQKINESECQQGCKCVGAVVSCTTENGKTINITAGNSGNYIYIYMEQTGANASTKMEIKTYSNGNVVMVKTVTSNGSEIEIKIMPGEAQEIALEKVKVRACNSENNCNLTLKEEKNKLKYEMQLERHSKILAIFQKKMQIRTEVDAETGKIIKIRKPWWAFLATEPKE